MRNRLVWSGAAAALLLSVLSFAPAAQDAEPPPAEGGRARPANVQLFGGGEYPGGYLKYTYRIGREGATLSSTTTTEITPLEDGTYRIVSTSDETVPLGMVRPGFYGVSLPRLGIRVPEAVSGTIDTTPLSHIASTAIEPGKNYLLPDGGRFQAGEAGQIAGVDVVFGTYTHADYTNVEIEFAFAMDLDVRNLMPFPALMRFGYTAASVSEDAPALRTFSSVELIEFVRRP